MQFCADTGVALAVVPAGTGNDLARTLGAPKDPLGATDALVAAIKAGERTTSTSAGSTGGPWFAGVLCAGFDSAVNERANRMRWPSGPRRYDLAILAELAKLRPRPADVVEDGDRDELDATQIAVGNIPYYGGGIPICPDADPTDGLFDITLVGRRQPARPGARCCPGCAPATTCTTRWSPRSRTARSALGEANGWVAYADGERIGPLPVEVSASRTP